MCKCQKISQIGRSIHEKFREFLLDLFGGRLSPEIASRLNKHFVREAPRELRAQGEVAAAVHLSRARERLLDYCRRWSELDDEYPLRHRPRHLYEAGAGDELEALLHQTGFVQEKINRFENPFPVAEDFRYLALFLLAESEVGKLVDLAVTEENYRRDGVAAALRVAGPERLAEVSEVVQTLLLRRSRRVSPLARLGTWLWACLPGRHRMTVPILNARRVALEVAYCLGLEEHLLRAAEDPAQAVRTLLVPYLYRYWHRDQHAGWLLMDQFNGRLTRWGLPNGRTIECYGGLCLAILIYHSEESIIIARLQTHWKQNVRRVLYLPEQAGRLRTYLLSRVLRLVIFLLARMLKLLMAAQPTFQPINLRELAKSFTHPGPEQQLGLEVLESLAHPELGFDGAMQVLMNRELPFGVYLMMVLERTLVFHGARERAGMLRALYRVHREGCAWFRQSALYVAFHTLNQAEFVAPDLLELYAQMTRETISTAHATFETELGVYELIPHMAWVEIVFDKRLPQGHAQFIPEFYREARESGDQEYARRVIGACTILSVAYHRHELALDALRAALDEHDPMLRAAVVEALCNIRFHAEEVLDRFLETADAKELAQLVVSLTPTLKSNDIFGWIDEYMNYVMIHSEQFRAEIVDAFARAGHARSLTQVLKWVINLSVGEKLLPL